MKTFAWMKMLPLTKYSIYFQCINLAKKEKARICERRWNMKIVGKEFSLDITKDYN